MDLNSIINSYIDPWTISINDSKSIIVLMNDFILIFLQNSDNDSDTNMRLYNNIYKEKLININVKVGKI